MKPEPTLDLLEFLLANTTLGTPPLVPEIRLRLADNVLQLWERTEGLVTANPAPPFWAFAWPGGQALARYFLDNADVCRGKAILDFGAGSGLVSIAAAKTGARALAADIDPLAITAIETNAVENNVTISPIKKDMIGLDEGWDTICLGDMCYERQLAERIADWTYTLKMRGAQILLGDPGRNYFFESNVDQLATYEVPTSHDLEGHEIRETSVYELQAKA